MDKMKRIRRKIQRKTAGPLLTTDPAGRGSRLKIEISDSFTVKVRLRDWNPA